MFGSKFWEEIAGSVARRWSDRILGPVLVFWGGLMIVYLASIDPPALAVRAHQLITVWQDLRAVNQTAGPFPEQLLLAAGGVLLLCAAIAVLVWLGACAAAVEAFQDPALRVLEGYWPWWLGSVRRVLIRRKRARLTRVTSRLRALANRYAELNADEAEEYTRLDEEHARLPEQLLPTDLGNVLRAAEVHSWQRYGLAATVVWPRLWLVLPSADRDELTGSRERLNATVRFVVWCAVFVAVTLTWTVIVLSARAATGSSSGYLSPLLASVVAASLAWWGYRRVLVAAEMFGDLVKAAFDVRHGDLIEAVGWPPLELHERPLARDRGEELTLFLHRGERPVAQPGTPSPVARVRRLLSKRTPARPQKETR